MTKTIENPKKILSRFVTNLEDDIYCIQNLPPEVVAVLFAYVSRSPESFRDNLLKLLTSGDLHVEEYLAGNPEDEPSDSFAAAKKKAETFHQKWVLGYGHASVAEHADIKFALENVSIIAAKEIEDCRLASFTEKSTRYQLFDPPRFYMGDDITSLKCKNQYEETARFLFSEYQALYNDAAKWLREINPKPEAVSQKAYENSIHAAACDIARYILPAGTLTSLGVSMNAREAAHAITKFLSSELHEMNVIGRRMLEEGRKITPVLLKHAERNRYIEENYSQLKSLSLNLQASASFESWNAQRPKKAVEIIHSDQDGEALIIAAHIYRHLSVPFDVVLSRVKKWNSELRQNVLDIILENIGPYDVPPRELEYAQVTSDILINYGAFRDIQRHRIATQTPQVETVINGFDTPDEVREINWEERFGTTMSRAAETFFIIDRETPELSRYIVPLAFRKRVLIRWNLRELFHFIRLRSAPAGHISYRKLAWELYDELLKIYPGIIKHFHINRDIPALGRLKSEVQEEQKHKKQHKEKEQ